MNTNILKMGLLAIALPVIAGEGFAAKGDKVQPVKKGETAEVQEKPPLVHKASGAPATGEEINWQVISSGGTEATSTNFGLKGTVGQTIVGSGSSTNFGLAHGFWQQFGGTTCCNHDGIRGDVNYDMALNVADLTYIVDYLFRGGPAPPCAEESDVNGDGPTNVADLTYIVDYLFRGGPPPPACP